ncbi:uncharacterized protein [Dermacentor albipictus]|uniref:uncharacterized protein n=1 Tax=Dermacentor albipictus TaxID=60249 RepID=UPI0031FC8662
MERRLTRRSWQESKPEEPVIACTQVDIGGRTLIDKNILDRLSQASDCTSGRGKFVRALLHHVFTDGGLHSKPLFGGRAAYVARRFKRRPSTLYARRPIGYTCSVAGSQCSIHQEEPILAFVINKMK